MWLTDLVVWSGGFSPKSFLHTLWLKSLKSSAWLTSQSHGSCLPYLFFRALIFCWRHSHMTHLPSIHLTILASFPSSWGHAHLHFKCPCLLFITIFYFSCCHYFIFAFSCTFILYSVLEMKVLNIFVFMYYAFSVITIQLWLLMVTYDCYECWAFTMHFGGHYYTVDV